MQTQVTLASKLKLKPLAFHEYEKHMSSITTVIAIISILAILVCSAFISQAVQQRREKHERLLAALRAKSRRFRAILNTCPSDFLSRDLIMLVLRTIIDTSEKLAQLEKSNNTHAQDVDIFTDQLKKIQQKDSHTAANTITNLMTIHAVKSSLKELDHYVHGLEEKQTLATNQTNVLKDQIKYLMFKLTIDAHELQAQTALDGNKLKLASHHYEIIVDMITKSAKNSPLAIKLPILEKHIIELKQRIAEEEKIYAIEEARREKEKDNGWKKRTMYDS